MRKGEFLDISGKRFGRLVALERVYRDNSGKWRWLCKCDCGNVVVKRLGGLTSGETRSCDCLSLVHGDNRKRLYVIWCSMKDRCYRKKNKNYNLYGGRGISVCDEWKLSYIAFRSWAIDHGYSESLTLDRKNGNDNYYPDNCRWATMLEQNNNRADNVKIKIGDETHNLSEWSRIRGLSLAMLADRRFRGWDERDLFIPKGSPRKYPLTCKNKGEHLNGPQL